MDIEPRKISMMLVPVYETKTTLTSEQPKHLYDAYSLSCPNMQSVLINADEADCKIKEWKAQGYGYSQCKWFLWAELNGK